MNESGYVASTGIEPVSGASETLILSIVLRGHENLRLPDGLNQSVKVRSEDLNGDGQQNYAKKFTYGN